VGKPSDRYEVAAGGEGAEKTAKNGGGHWRGMERGEGTYQTRAGEEAARKIRELISKLREQETMGRPRWGIVPEPTFKREDSRRHMWTFHRAHGMMAVEFGKLKGGALDIEPTRTGGC
jgi:hypothetical protein